MYYCLHFGDPSDFFTLLALIVNVDYGCPLDADAFEEIEQSGDNGKAPPPPPQRFVFKSV